MKFLKQSVKASAIVVLPLLAQGLTISAAKAQAPFGTPNPNNPFGKPAAGGAPAGAFGAPNPNNPFGQPAAGAPTGGITPNGTPPLPTMARQVVAVPTTYLWDSGGQVAISRVGTWGNGVGQITRALTYNGDDVLEMTTRNFNEGVSFEFSPPVNLNDYKTEGYLRLRLRFQEAVTAMPGGFSGEGSGSSSSSSSGFGGPSMSATNQMAPGFGRNSEGGSSSEGSSDGSGRGGRGRGGRGRRGRGSSGGFGGMRGALPQETKIHRMMVTFVLEKGVASGTIDLPTDLSKVQPDDAGWRLFLLPVTDLKFTPGATGQAQRMIVTSDARDTFYMAQSALVVETGQMSVNIRRPTDPLATQLGELTVKPGLVTLVADVEAGTADPLIEWNFDANNVNPDIAMRRAPLGGPGGFPGNPEGTPGGGFGGAPGGFGGPTPGGFGGAPGGGFGGPTPGGFGGAPGGGFGDPTPDGGFGGPTPGGGFGSSSGQFGAPGGLFGGENGPSMIPAGPPVDARGLVAKFDYPNEEMDYRVEVTVTDRAGKKAPAKASILIKVRN